MKKDYIAVYKKVITETGDFALSHITNIANVKYKITKRAFDFDTASFSGTAEEDASEGFIYIFKNKTGKNLNAGFMASIEHKDNDEISFKGVDFKTVFDTDIYVSYAREQLSANAEDELLLENIIKKTISLIRDYFIDGIIPKEKALFPDIEIASVDTYFTEEDKAILFGNVFGEDQITNAMKYLKLFLAYFECYFDLNIELTKTSD